MSEPKPGEFCVAPVVHEGHKNVVYSVAFAPDGRSIASGSMDRTSRTFVYGILILDDKGNIIASGSNDNSVRLWEVQSQSESSVFTGHYGRVNSVAFSPDGAYITSGSDDTTIRIWDVERGVTISEPFQGNTSPVRSISYSPDGSQIVSGSPDSTIQLWDARSGKTIAKSYEGHAGSVCSVAFSPTGVFLASGSYDRTIRVWDIRAGRLAMDPLEGHTGYVYSVAFSPSGNQIVSGSNDGRVIVWTIHDSNRDTNHGLDVPVANHGSPLNLKSTERISRHMSMKILFSLLLQHGCIDVTSQMDPTQDSNFIVNGGGFGDIWTGRLRDGTKVAIKVWRSSVIEQCDDKALKRAAREVYYWSRMKHRNIHQLLGVIIFREHSLGMVSEWMENGNLREHMRKNDSFDRYEMCISIASGLVYMHQRDALHGDLKALNVLVSSDGVAKIADFGLSTMSEASLGFSETSNPQTGSTRWAAPELLTEEAPKSKESDVYALGMTMLEVITGEVPFPQCHSDYQVIVKVMQGAQPSRPMTQLKNDDRGDQMWNLLVSCWSPEPSARPSAQQVLESLISIRALPE
ncbi:hypothetical protein OPQ81_002824 [Rhizoctonia solani]|nr:hypothetical protein OPQ81_002824 [Rhizoctonia solani]